MNNVQQEVQGDTLILKINLKAPGKPSSTGKTLIVASSEGNKPVPGHPDLKIGINVYRSAS